MTKLAKICTPALIERTARVLHDSSTHELGWEECTLSERRGFARMAKAVLAELSASALWESTPPPGARATDPASSQASASPTPVRKQQCLTLLKEFGKSPGLTDRDAAIKAGLVDTPVCWWKRCSDLRARGFITPRLAPDGSDMLVLGDLGRPVRVCVITDAGRFHLARKAVRP